MNYEITIDDIKALEWCASFSPECEGLVCDGDKQEIDFYFSEKEDDQCNS